MDAGQLLEASIAMSSFTEQRKHLRYFLVISYVLLAAASLVAAFFLSWFAKPGAGWFVCAAVFLGLWAAVTATCSRVSAGDVLGFARVFRPNDRGAA
jgi:membrane protein implicated in regulation of membrane protease activity